MSHLPDITLHAFEWARPSLTYGVLVKPDQLLQFEALARLGVDSAQRPTGGGVMFHVEDLSFSLAVPAHCPGYSPSPERNYRWVNQAVARAIARCMGQSEATLLHEESRPSSPRAARFCMSTPTRYDIFWQGKKVGGSAQRCTRHGFLHQGSIALAPTPTHWLDSCIRSPEQVRPGIERHAGALLPDSPFSDIHELRRVLRQILQEELAQAVAQQQDFRSPPDAMSTPL